MKSSTTPSEHSKKPRLVWIDIAKGIGIIMIVCHHNFHFFTLHSMTKYIYWFFPVFFIVSGILHKQRDSQYEFIKRKFMHLLVPYTTYLFLWFLAIQLGLAEKISTINLLLGGRFFLGSVGSIWWFVTCLFATQVLSSFLLKIKSTKMQVYSTVFVYYIAMLIPFCCSVIMWSIIVVTFRLPLSFDVALMATIYYLIGYALKPLLVTQKRFAPYVTLCLLGILFFLNYLEKNSLVFFPSFNMYAQHYSLPFINVFIPVSFFIILREIALLISGNVVLRRMLVEIGQASMTIMFLHMVLASLLISCVERFTSVNVTSLPIRIILGITLPYIAHRLFSQYGLTRRLFLGEWE
jgi:fucose 4-O-acetylase-like acetyltransferase